jgi:hypothetical protein
MIFFISKIEIYCFIPLIYICILFCNVGFEVPKQVTMKRTMLFDVTTYIPLTKKSARTATKNISCSSIPWIILRPRMSKHVPPKYQSPCQTLWHCVPEYITQFCTVLTQINDKSKLVPVLN